MAPRTKEELFKSGEMAQAMAEELKRNPLPPALDSIDIFAQQAHRQAVIHARHPLRVLPSAISEVKEEDRMITVRDGSDIRARVYTPMVVPLGGSPLIVMFHEGGWCMGDITDEEVNCRMFTRDLGAVCVNVDYRLAPLAPFPTPVHDCWDALKWAAASSSTLNTDPRRGFLVGGASAGGNISAIMAHLARDEHLDPPLTGQYLCVPALLDESVVPEAYKAEYFSREHNINDPVLRMNGNTLVRDAYKPDTENPLYNIFNHPNHKGLPPAYFQVCGLDPLRDEGLLYERVLREEDHVDTKLDLYPGYGHMFWTNFPQMDMSRKFVADTLEGVKWLLGLASTARRP